MHDIGKSLVNTILTNNGYNRRRPRQAVPVQTIIDAAVEHDADAIGLSALLVSTSKQMPLALQELRKQGHAYPCSSAAPRSPRVREPRDLRQRKDDDTVYEAGAYYCKDAFEGLAVMDQLVEPEQRKALVEKTFAAAEAQRNKVEIVEDLPPTTDTSVRSAVRTDAPIPTPPFWACRKCPST